MSSDTSNFHKNKKSAAVLKHAIINSYATPFASKTGSTSKDHRVAFIDGYAGPGRYEDGEPGSGALLLETAKRLASRPNPRTVECHFVEADPDTVARLRDVAKVDGEGVRYTISQEGISERLPSLLALANGIPLFVYLDPCGLPIPLQEVASIFGRPSGPGAPATEVLINLTAGLRRFAGMLYSDKPLENSLRTLDAACGGDWWRAAWLAKCPTRDCPEDQKMAAELAVVREYAARLNQQAGGPGTWVIDVKPRAGLKPVYYLVFATRSVHGLVTFGQAASLGLERWREYLAAHEAEDTLFGSDWKTRWKAQEEILKEQWVRMLTSRLTAELAKGQPFTVMQKAEHVLGRDLAHLVRQKHVKAAIDNARAAQKTTTLTKGVKNVYTLLLKPT